MHWLLIVGVSLAAAVTLLAVAAAILIHRLNRWADAMIRSIGMPDLWPPEPTATEDNAKSGPCGKGADAARMRHLCWDKPSTINPSFRRLPSAKNQIAPEK